MGNEGSVPQQGTTEAEQTVDEQLEYQAKAPPSATHPPGIMNGDANGNAAQPPPPPNQQQQTAAGKGRLMGSVFTRRGNAHNQNSTGIVVESAQSYPPSHYSGREDNTANAAVVQPMPGEELTYMNAPDASGYYQQQQQQHGPPPPQQPMYMQQQQQQLQSQNNYSKQQQPQHVIPNQQYYNNDVASGGNGDSSPVVGVMYSTAATNQTASTVTATTATSSSTPASLGKKSRRAVGAGLISSMRNLSLGFGSSSSNANSSPARRTQRQQQQTVNDWETRWDEDEDEEEEEEENDEEETEEFQSARQGSMQVQQPQPPPALHPQMRPDMDAGYAASASAAAAAAVSPMPNQTAYSQQQQQQQQQQVPFVSPQQSSQSSTLQPQYTTPMKKAHLVTATPETPQVMDDGVEWDTGMQEVSDKTDKPNVEQFMPLLRVLGKGSFGKVVLVQKRVGRETGSLFAMKILRKSHLVRRRQIERTRTERKVLSVVNHPFIMKLHYAFQSPDKLYLVLDYCPGGELFFHLSRFRRFPERVARFYSAELLLALGHLHKRGIIYRDLKPENVLLDADGHVKLGDFGLAKAGIRHAYEGATSMCGTPEYMAPEVLAQQGHGFCVDYWGLGMLTYEMMTGLPPWYTTDRAKLFRRLRSAPLDIPSYFSASSASFSGALLERNPRRRLGVTGIRAAMEHEFFKSISWRALYGRRVEAPIRPCEGWSPPEASNDASTNQQPQSFPGSGQSALSNGSMVNPGDLDAATANFDNQFTRMPVESDHAGEPDDDEDMEELHEDTFVGFTFDDNDRDELEAAQQAQKAQQQMQQQQARQRTHHYEGGNSNGNQAQHHLD